MPAGGWEAVKLCTSAPCREWCQRGMDLKQTLGRMTWALSPTHTHLLCFYSTRSHTQAHLSFPLQTHGAESVGQLLRVAAFRHTAAPALMNSLEGKAQSAAACLPACTRYRLWSRGGTHMAKQEEGDEREREMKNRGSRRTERATERWRGHVGSGLLVLPSGQLADLFIWFITLSPALGFGVCSRSRSPRIYHACHFEIAASIYFEALKQAWHIHCLQHHITAAITAPHRSRHPHMQAKPTMTCSRQTNSDNRLDACSSLCTSCPHCSIWNRIRKIAHLSPVEQRTHASI